MLLSFQRILRKAADKPARVTEELVSADCVERVRESGEHEGQPCVDILAEGEWIRCLGTVQDVGHTVNTVLMSDGVREVSRVDHDRGEHRDNGR